MPGAGRLRQRYYAWRHRPRSARAQADRALIEQIRAIHERARGTYGAPRIHAELAAQGVHVGQKRVARLLQAAGLAGVSRRPFVTTTRRDPTARPTPDLVQRRFAVEGPNQLWVADITYIPTWAGFLYLAVVLDAWSRRVVGWAMATHLWTDRRGELLDLGDERRQDGNQGLNEFAAGLGLRVARPAQGGAAQAGQQLGRGATAE